MQNIVEQLNEATAVLTDHFPEVPKVALVTGSGFSFIESHLTDSLSLSYRDIPHLQPCTNPAHPGRLVVGKLNGVPIAVLLGRLHCYEGFSSQELVFPVRLLAWWGVDGFMLTNAAGGLSPALRIGNLMAMTDHINLTGRNPLIGPNEEALGPRFPDMTKTYNAEVIDAAQSTAKKEGFELCTGVYLAVPGPSYETPAEVCMLRAFGADVVGMSTIPEAIALTHMGKSIFALSCVTNEAAGMSDTPISDDDVRDVLGRDVVRRRALIVLTAVAHKLHAMALKA